MVEYGVFQLGHVWKVVRDGEAMLALPTRERAVAAGRRMAASDRAQGEKASVSLQDGYGRLVRDGDPAASQRRPEA